ncbi:MAG TPA: hypothetical protein ENL03_01520 [Phycisphaerae bacterium]|nr:hypothetical protein [Phycisphaerae bacterium]
MHLKYISHGWLKGVQRVTPPPLLPAIEGFTDGVIEGMTLYSELGTPQAGQALEVAQAACKISNQ